MRVHWAVGLRRLLMSGWFLLPPMSALAGGPLHFYEGKVCVQRSTEPLLRVRPSCPETNICWAERTARRRCARSADTSGSCRLASPVGYWRSKRPRKGVLSSREQQDRELEWPEIPECMCTCSSAYIQMQAMYREEPDVM